MLTLAVPIFNKAPYLPRCIDSLLNQTAGDYEILLIDDGSTDDSGAICDRYAAAHPDRIRVIHKENGGLSDARNTGIEAARGEWITFPDPDDWVEPDYIEAFSSLQKEYQTDLVCTGFWVEEGGESHPGYRDAETVTMTAGEGRKALLLPPQMGGFSWNKCYRLALLRRHGLRFRSDVGATEDLDFAYRYLKHCAGICFCPTSRTYHYDQHQGSATHSFSRRNLEDFRTYEMIAADADQALVSVARELCCVIAVNHLWALLRQPQPSPEDKRILLKQIRRDLPVHLKSSRYSVKRKLQAMTAAIAPGLFAVLKNRFHFAEHRKVHMNPIKELLYRIRGEYTTEKLIRMGMTVGKNFGRLNGVILDPSHCWLITIGDNVTMAPRVHILCHDASTKRFLGYTKIGRVNIGNNVFIGAESVVLPGVTIGSNVIIGANSTVTHDIPEGMVVAGSPARVICTLEEYLNKERARMETAPCYGAEYTLGENASMERRMEQKDALDGKIGYIV